MIKALILDIDGVMLGHKDELNFPLPSNEIQNRLQNLSKLYPISLCTVKAYFAVKPIVEACGIVDNFHVTDAGATIINEKKNIFNTTSIDLDQAKLIIEELRKSEIYVEWYDANEYYALNHENSLVRDGRTKLLGHEAILSNEVTSTSISKIIVFPMNEWQTTSLITIAKKYDEFMDLHWGYNPSLIPKQNAFLTHPTATKRTGVEHLEKFTGVPLSQTLAIGDSTNDWTFMELCGYKATLENGSPELKELVSNEQKRGFISTKSVDEDGLLEILNHFKL